MENETTQEGVSQNPFSGDATDALANAWNPENQPEPEEPQSEEQGEEQQDEPVAEPEESPKDEPEEEGNTLKSLQDFLETNEIDTEDFHNLNVKVKVDGKESEVPLKDVLKSYQLEGHVNNKSIELSNAQKQYEAERQQWQQRVQQELQQHQAVAQYANELINQDFSHIDWNELRANDPIEYQLKRQELSDRQQGVQGYLSQIGQLHQQAAQEQQQLVQAKLVEEVEHTLSAIPEWRDEGVRQKEIQQINSYLQKRGFSEGEIGQVLDHRIYPVARDAARYSALEASKPETTKRVRQAPRMTKPGIRLGKNPNVKRKEQTLAALKSNPRDIDVQAAAFDY